MRRTLRYRGIAAMVVLALSISGGTPVCAAAENQTKGSEGNLAEQLQKKYAGNEAYVYGEPIYDLGRSENIPLDIGFDPKEKGMETCAEIAGLYKDADLTQEAGNAYEISEDRKHIEITPPREGDAKIWNSGLSRDEYGMEGSEYVLFEKEEFKDWGNVGKFYLAIYVDLETGAPLDRPEVRVVTIKGELDTPQVKFIESEEGTAAFRWETVENAEKYLIVSLDDDQERGIDGKARVIGETKETSWEYEVLKGDAVINSQFNIASVSEDAWLDEGMLDHYIEKYGEEAKGKVVKREVASGTSYGVIAIGEEGTSMISNLYSGEELAALLVYRQATFVGKEEKSNTVDGFAEIKSYRWVIMCDGRVVQKLVNYDIEKAKEDTVRWGYYEDEEMSDIEFVDVEVIKIPYKIEGTPFEGILAVENYNKETVKEDLETLKERQEGLRSKTGNIDDQTIRMGKKEKQTSQSDKPKNVKATDKITANSALSEYLAIKMLAGEEIIDLSDFKETSDRDYLTDAFQEAKYQNPLILGIADANLSWDRKSLIVKYEEDANKRQKKQQELRDKVKTITKEIIKADMSDLEKEVAINEYLCDKAEYDFDALENAEQYDYVKVDEKFFDSFTAYGILLEEIGVCASYSASFKLLADAAGLDCVVVTGYLDGSLAHAWNRVKIDGEWRTVDTTNNDNEQLPNALLNLPDYAAKKVLIEDKEYAMDNMLKLFVAEGDDLEYYRTEGKYFDTAEIATKLAAELDKDGVTVLRTDYDLNDLLFKEILTSTSEKAAKKPTGGYYWMGVIYLESK